MSMPSQASHRGLSYWCTRHQQSQATTAPLHMYTPITWHATANHSTELEQSSWSSNTSIHNHQSTLNTPLTWSHWHHNTLTSGLIWCARNSTQLLSVNLELHKPIGGGDEAPQTPSSMARGLMRRRVCGEVVKIFWFGSQYDDFWCILGGIFYSSVTCFRCKMV